MSQVGLVCVSFTCTVTFALCVRSIRPSSQDALIERVGPDIPIGLMVRRQTRSDSTGGLRKHSPYDSSSGNVNYLAFRALVPCGCGV